RLRPGPHPEGKSLTTPAFDSHADQYETDCMRGLRVSGESKEFFARGRIEHVLQLLTRRSARAPKLVVDFGCGVGDVTSLLGDFFPGAEVMGLDPSPRCVERARRQRSAPRVRFLEI